MHKKEEALPVVIVNFGIQGSQKALEPPPRLMRLRPLVLYCTLAVGALSQPTWADQYDTLNVFASTAILYDSNVFRLHDSVNPQATLGTSEKSDFISVSSVGLRINKPYSLQRFELELSETIYRYNNFSFLDFEATEYRGAWHWHVTPRVRGVLSAERRKQLVPFQDLRGIEQVTRTNENQVFSLDATVSGGWHILLGASRAVSQHSRQIAFEESYDAVTQEAGVKYLASSGSSVAVVQRLLQGEYRNRQIDPTNFTDNEFRETQSEVQADWRATGHSVVSAKLAWLDRQHPNFAQRDFEGLAGQIAYIWTPTGKMQVTATANRIIHTWWDVDSSYRVSNEFGVGSTWRASAKVTVGGRVDYIRRDYRGSVRPLLAAAREDTERRGQLYLEWAPRRSVSVKAGIEHQTLSSNRPALDFDSTSANVAGSVLF